MSLAYGACGPALLLHELDLVSDQLPSFLDNFVAAGIPTEVREVVGALVAGDADGALLSLSQWDV